MPDMPTGHAPTCFDQYEPADDCEKCKGLRVHLGAARFASTRHRVLAKITAEQIAQAQTGASRCAVQQEPDGRHAIFHSPDCDETRCGIDIIELPADHDASTYDHLAGAGTLHIPESLGLLEVPPGTYPFAPAPADRKNWGHVTIAASRLYRNLTGTELPLYPQTQDDHGTVNPDIAREQLARLGAVILLELFEHAVDTDDERPLEVLVAAIMESGRFPAGAAAAIGPPIGDLVAAIAPLMAAHQDADYLAEGADQ